MHKKFEINRVKIKRGCQSGRKVVTYNSKSDLPLASINIFTIFLSMFLGGKGHALLILRPEELGFLRYLRQANVPLNEFEFSWSKVSDIQPQLEKLISKNYFLNLSAKEAFKGYARAYESHSLKQVCK